MNRPTIQDACALDAATQLTDEERAGLALAISEMTQLATPMARRYALAGRIALCADRPHPADRDPDLDGPGSRLYVGLDVELVADAWPVALAADLSLAAYISGVVRTALAAHL